jgi:hypothetical protein
MERRHTADRVSSAPLARPGQLRARCASGRVRRGCAQEREQSVSSHNALLPVQVHWAAGHSGSIRGLTTTRPVLDSIPCTEIRNGIPRRKHTAV